MVWPSAVVPAIPGLPGVTTTSAVRASDQGQGVLPPAGADHADASDRPVRDGRSCGEPDELLAAGAHADQLDRHADLLGQEVHVVPGRLGQVVELGGRRQVAPSSRAAPRRPG